MKELLEIKNIDILISNYEQLKKINPDFILHETAVISPLVISTLSVETVSKYNHLQQKQISYAYNNGKLDLSLMGAILEVMPNFSVNNINHLNTIKDATEIMIGNKKTLLK